MAPLANEPRQILIVLNLAKRKALYTLVTEIVQYMRSQLRLEIPSNENSSSRNKDAPLFVAKTSRDNSPDDSGRPGPPQRSLSAPLPPPELVRLRRAALAHFDAWQTDILNKLKELLSQQDDAGVVVDRRERANRLARRRADVPSPGESLIDFGDADRGKLAAEATRSRDVARLQQSYHPIPTRLTTILVEDREETLSCVLLVLLSTGKYVAESRTLAVYLTSAFGLPISVLNTEEAEIAKLLIEKSTSEEAQRHMSAEAEAQKRKQENQTSRMWKVGLGTVAGAALVGITGGLAAPVVAGAIGGLMGTVGLGGVASFLGVFWMNGALVGTLFGAFGAKMTGEMIDRYAREVQDFRFIPLRGARDPRYRRAAVQDQMRLRVTIGVNGWLTEEKDITGPWEFLGDDSEVFALRYEVDSLMGLGQSLKDLVSSRSWNFVKAEILKRTVLATLWSALWPAYLLSAAAGVDNPFSLARNRSEKAGEILADAIINRVQGERPVTLIGYSLGARAIYSCLRSLAARQAFGLVDTVVFIGSPVPSNTQHWQIMRSVVSGKIYNAYSENDFLLAFLYRATSIQLGVAGLQPIQGVEGVENINLTEEVQGHLRYAGNIAKILDRCGFPVVEGAAGPIEKEQDTGIITLDDMERGPKTGTLIDFGDLAIEDKPPAVEPMKSGTKPSPAFSSPSTSSRPSQSSKPARQALSPSAMLAAEYDDPLGGRNVSKEVTGSDETARPGQQSARAMSAPQVPTASQPKSTPLSPLSPLSPLPSSHSTQPAPSTTPKRVESKQELPSHPPRVPGPASNTREITRESAADRKQKLLAVNEHAISSMPQAAVSAPVLTSSSQKPDTYTSHDSDDEDYGGIKMVDNDEEDFEYLDPAPIEDDYDTWVK
ncbi:Protein of unknown function (DUF726) domain containing protein [Naviculisporaceae sp. PSN 640]